MDWQKLSKEEEEQLDKRVRNLCRIFHKRDLALMVVQAELCMEKEKMC